MFVLCNSNSKDVTHLRTVGVVIKSETILYGVNFITVILSINYNMFITFDMQLLVTEIMYTI